jgi:hypothetical protein
VPAISQMRMIQLPFLWEPTTPNILTAAFSRSLPESDGVSTQIGRGLRHCILGSLKRACVPMTPLGTRAFSLHSDSCRLVPALVLHRDGPSFSFQCWGRFINRQRHPSPHYVVHATLFLRTNV